MIHGLGISWEIALTWLSLDPIDDKSKLVKFMAWCRQAHYLPESRHIIVEMPLAIIDFLQSPIFFHTRLWFPASDSDFQQFKSDFHVLWSYHRKKNIVEEMESIISARAEQGSPSWVCIR